MTIKEIEDYAAFINETADVHNYLPVISSDKSQVELRFVKGMEYKPSGAIDTAKAEYFLITVPITG